MFQFDNGLFCGQPTFQKAIIVRVICFQRVTAAKFTVKSIIRGKFCILIFCWGDETFRRERSVLSLKFCMLSRRNQDLLRLQENS